MKLIVFAFLFSNSVMAGSLAGYNLTETDLAKYDAFAQGPTKTSAQDIVDQVYDLGVRHINLNPRAVMIGYRANELLPVTRADDRSDERRRYMRLIQYIHSKKMTVGIRPIFFVVDQNGHTPLEEKLADGTIKVWWHGNIQPENPDKWFESFKAYLDQYFVIAKAAQVEEFTIGAELYSMTVGIEDQWAEYPFGFPGRWVELIRYGRTKLPQNCRVMYDVNFTDATVSVGGGVQASGGEIERWRYRLVDLEDRTNPYWNDLVSLWKELDAVGIDMYRSLIARDQVIPQDPDKLLMVLKQTSDRYANQLDTALFEIENTLGFSKDIILKEIGFRSVEKGFLDPFVFSGSDAKPLNIAHQAIATEALLQSFWTANWSWFRGVVFWDVSVDASQHGAADRGFSPLGKTLTENVIKKYFKN
jgi:hypothetical protein